MKLRNCALIATITLVAVSCSFSLNIGGEDPAEASTNLIEGELAEMIDLGPIEATCESPESVEVGTMWGCTGVVDDGTIDFAVEVDREDHINIETTNLVIGSQVERIATEAASLITEFAGAEVGSDSVDCGQDSLILPPSNEIQCTVDAGDELIETVITITDLDNTSIELDTDPLIAALALPRLTTVAVAIIEDELADLIALGPIEAMCEQPASADAGTAWNCSGEVAGEVAQFIATTDGDDNVNVNTLNVVLGDQAQAFAVAAMRQLNESVGATLPDEAMDCGTMSLLLPPTSEFICALDTGDGIFDATITITDPENGGFAVQIADEPRG